MTEAQERRSDAGPAGAARSASRTGRPLAPKPWSPRFFKWILRGFPPYLLSRTWVEAVGDDFLSCRLRVKRTRLSRNLNGTTFGGTLYAAGDPIFAVLLWQALAHRGVAAEAWTRSAHVLFARPARTDLVYDFALTESDVEDAFAAMRADGRFERSFFVDGVDANGETCVRVDTTIVLREARG